MRKQEKGITLIALVVTIVVLLILAAVSISMLGGENGIITQAIEAKEKNRAGIVKETRDIWRTENNINTQKKPRRDVLRELQDKGYLTEKEVEEIETTNKVIIAGETIEFEADINLQIVNSEFQGRNVLFVVVDSSNISSEIEIAKEKKQKDINTMSVDQLKQEFIKSMGAIATMMKGIYINTEGELISFLNEMNHTNFQSLEEMHQAEGNSITFEDYLKENIIEVINDYKSGVFEVLLTMPNNEQINTRLICLESDSNIYSGIFPINSDGRYEVKVSIYGTNVSGEKNLELASNYEFKMNDINTKGYIYDSYANKNIVIDNAYVVINGNTIDVSQYIYQESEEIYYIDLREIYNSVTNSLPYGLQLESNGKTVFFSVEVPPKDVQ